MLFVPQVHFVAYPFRGPSLVLLIPDAFFNSNLHRMRVSLSPLFAELVIHLLELFSIAVLFVLSPAVDPFVAGSPGRGWRT